MTFNEETLKEIKELLKWIEKEETEAIKEGWGVAPFPYERLAILYRKNKEYSAEVAILEQFAEQPHAPGVKPAKLLERLNAARKLLASQKKEL